VNCAAIEFGLAFGLAAGIGILLAAGPVIALIWAAGALRRLYHRLASRPTTSSTPEDR
jgi:hypothetical protein